MTLGSASTASTASGPRQRVVFNGRFLAQVHTGVQRYAAETLMALDALIQARPELAERWKFELAVPDAARPLPLRWIPTVPVKGRGSHFWEQWPLLLHSRDAFLVNFNYSGPLLKRHQMVTVHDATVRAMPESFTRGYRWVHNAMVSVLGRTARSVMTVSNFSRDELGRWFGLQRSDIVVGREGGEHAVRAADDAAVLQRHGLAPGRYILGVGSVKPNKNFDLLGRAMRLLPDYPLPVAVAGAKDIGIFRGAAESADGFRFLGFVDDDDLAVLYRHAAWFVLPSLYEGFGLPAVEAMANGCPVLAARAASIPEVCGDAALYFDPHDAESLAALLRRVAEQPQLRTPLVAAGRERLSRYHWRANAPILLDHLTQRLQAAPAARLASSADDPALPRPGSN